MSKYGMGLLRSARLTRRQLIAFALVSAVLNGIVTACVGTWLAQTYATEQSRRKSVETLAHLIYDRRTRAGMVVSSLRRNAAIEEIEYRKRAYDEAYVDWNKNILLSLFAIREVAGDLQFATLVKAFEDELVASWPRHMKSVPAHVRRTRLQLSQKLCVIGVMNPSRPPVSRTRT